MRTLNFIRSGTSHKIKSFVHTAVAASGPNTEILQFYWFISGQIFPVLPNQGDYLKTQCLCRMKIKIFVKIWNESVLGTIRKGEVTTQCKIGEKILYQMKTELQVFIWRLSVPLHNYISVKPYNKLVIDLAYSVSTSEISDICFCPRYVLKNIGPIFY